MFNYNLPGHDKPTEVFPSRTWLPLQLFLRILRYTRPFSGRQLNFPTRKWFSPRTGILLYRSPRTPGILLYRPLRGEINPNRSFLGTKATYVREPKIFQPHRLNVGRNHGTNTTRIERTNFFFEIFGETLAAVRKPYLHGKLST